MQDGKSYFVVFLCVAVMLAAMWGINRAVDPVQGVVDAEGFRAFPGGDAAVTVTASSCTNNGVLVLSDDGERGVCIWADGTDKTAVEFVGAASPEKPHMLYDWTTGTIESYSGITGFDFDIFTTPDACLMRATGMTCVGGFYSPSGTISALTGVYSDYLQVGSLISAGIGTTDICDSSNSCGAFYSGDGTDGAQTVVQANQSSLNPTIGVTAGNEWTISPSVSGLVSTDSCSNWRSQVFTLSETITQWGRLHFDTLSSARSVGLYSFVPRETTFIEAYVLTSNPGTGNSRTFTLENNTSDTAFTCTITGTGAGGALSCSITTPVTFAAHDLATWHFTLTGTPADDVVTWLSWCTGIK